MLFGKFTTAKAIVKKYKNCDKPQDEPKSIKRKAKK